MTAFTTWRDWARNRGRVRNKATGEVGNLVEWSSGCCAKVFTGYEQIGACKLPIFERWAKSVVEVESNDTHIERRKDMNAHYPKTPSEVWEEIKGKAHLYKTARIGNKYVKILGVARDGTFHIEHPLYGPMDAGCHELTDYCL